jgi:hypothetical protein
VSVCVCVCVCVFSECLVVCKELLEFAWLVSVSQWDQDLNLSLPLRLCDTNHSLGRCEFFR